MAANRYPPASLVVTVSAAVSLSACAGRQYRPADSRAGVQVITAEQIARSGASTAWDVLKREAPTLTLRDTRGGRPAEAGRPPRVSRSVNVGASRFSTSQAVLAPERAICSAVMTWTPARESAGRYWRPAHALSETAAETVTTKDAGGYRFAAICVHSRPPDPHSQASFQP